MIDITAYCLKKRIYKMPSVCSCPNNCVKHDICKCGDIKKRNSETCRKCFLNPKYKCISCGKKRKKTTSNICRECYDQQRTDIILSNSTPIKELFYKSGERNKYNGVRSHSRRLISSLKIKLICSCCFFKKGVQICHIIPINSFDENTPLNVVNSLDNLILLCPNCHWLFDHGYNSIEKLKKYYESIS